MTDFRIIVGCPWCHHEYGEEESEEMAEGFHAQVCEKCGRRFRIFTQEEIVHVQTAKYCAKDQCQWKATVSPDFEKCVNCFDIRKVPQPVVTLSQ